MAAASATDELKALEEARARLEAALAGDENWRALTKPVADDPRPGAAMARLARNNRLKMALADNELYQAWKHVSDAINALRARHGANANSRLEPAADTQPEPAAVRDTPAAAPSADAALRVARRLMERLEAVQAQPAAAAAVAPAAKPAAGSAADDRNSVRRRPQPKALPVVAEPDEATVTFVVREPPVAHAGEPDVERDGLPTDHPWGADPVAGLPGKPAPPFAPLAEEAEVSILSGERVRQLREAEERASIVRRFRKALSGE